MSFRQPYIVQPTFKAELKAQEDIHDDIGFIRQALRDGLRRYAYRCVLELESVLIADGIADKEFLEDVYRLRDEFKNECEARKAKYQVEQDESECADMVNAPDLTPDLDHLYERLTIIIEFAQRKDIYLKSKRKVHQSDK